MELIVCMFVWPPRLEGMGECQIGGYVFVFPPTHLFKGVLEKVIQQMVWECPIGKRWWHVCAYVLVVSQEGVV